MAAVSRTDAVLASIDGALWDYEDSADAMRWSLEPDKFAAWPEVDPAEALAALHAAVEQIRPVLARWVTHARAAIVEMDRTLGPLVKALQKTSATLVSPPPNRCELAGRRRVDTAMRRVQRRAVRRTTAG